MATATEEVRLSRVGKRPVVIPKGVTVNLSDVKLDVQGPKGKMSVPIPGQVVAKKDGDAISFTSSAPGRDGARLQGLARALFASAVKGSAEGYERVLELVGVSYFNLPAARGGYLSSGNTGAPPPKLAEPGDYVVTLVAGAETMNRRLRIERSSSGAARP